MTPIDVQALMRLVRLSLSADTVREDDLLPQNIDWPELLAIAWRQGVSALVLDGLERQSVLQRPHMPLLLEWIGRVNMMEQLHAQHERCIASLADFYAQHGIRMLLLKGIGCSWDWPKPEHRPVGDADVFLFGKQDEADRLMQEECGVEVHRQYHKHSTFLFQGVEVENHAKFLDDVTHKTNISFEETLHQVLQTEECVPSPIENVLLPPATFNALFLLRHTGEHFAANEIILRQILDVGTFFQHHHEDVNWDVLYRVLKQERMLQFYHAIATICVEHLGIEKDSFQSVNGTFLYIPHEELAHRILADIFQEKSVLPMSLTGIDSPSQKIKYAIDKTQRWWHNRWKYRLVYNENMWQSFWWLARNRMSI